MFGPLSCYCCIFGWAFKEFHSHFMVMCYISGIFHRFWLGTRAWTSLPKNCFWNCYKTQSKYVPMCKLKLYICRENIDFFWRFEICWWKYWWTFLKIFNNIFFSLHFWYDVDKTRQQQNQSLVILRSYNHLHQP